LLKLLDSPNLFEADFKGFFDNVTHDGISSVLVNLGLPAPEVDFIRSLNKSIVRLPGSLHLDETKVDLVGQFYNEHEL
jgi:hypothetical protein